MMPELAADRAPWLEAVRALRQHYELDRATGEDCVLCELWLAYVRRDLPALEEIVERTAPEPGDLVGELMEAIRDACTEWGEAEWTARDVPRETV